MSWAIAASVGVGLLSANETSKSNARAAEAADKANTANNALRDQAMPYALENLKTNQALQKFYQQNPFSATQKGAYQGLFDTIANNQAGGNTLLANASNFGRSNRGVMPAMQAMPTGTKAATIDWQGMNPFTPPADAVATQTVTPADYLLDPELERRRLVEQQLADQRTAEQLWADRAANFG